jgi:energy-converting hydrogenase Eha subunit C
MDKKIVAFLALIGGVAVLLGTFTNVLGRYPLELIGGIAALVAGLLGLFDKGV